MTIFKFILWFLLTAAVYGVLFAVWIPLRKKNKRWISIVDIILEIVLAIAGAFSISRSIRFCRVCPNVSSRCCIPRCWLTPRPSLCS